MKKGARSKKEPAAPLSLSALRKLARRWEKKADKALSVYARATTLRQEGHCAFCEGPVEHCFHFISRRRRIVRWLFLNVIGSCRKCNKYERYFPDKFRAWFIRRYGVHVYLNLVRVAEKEWRTLDKLDYVEVQRLIRYLERVTDFYKRKYTELVRKD